MSVKQRYDVDVAREYSESLAQIGTGWWRQVAWAHRQGIPDALGMTTREWVAAFVGGWAKLLIDDRREAVLELTSGDDRMSNRDAADVLGVDEKTVRNDRAAAEKSASDEEWEQEAAEFSAPILSPEDETLIARVRDGETVVINLRSHGAVADILEAEKKYVRIDRRTDWGNPFELPDDGDRATVIRHFAKHYLPFKPSLGGRLPELRGKALGCWCVPESCHGDVLREALERHDDHD